MRRHWLADAALGALSGAAASWVMEKVQTLGTQDSGPPPGQRDPSEVQRNESAASDPATVKAAQTAAGFFGKTIPDEKKHLAGELVHFGHGAFWGAVYALAAPREANAFVAGLAFGTGLWLVADEILVPLLGWAEGPTAYPASVHAKALGAHLAYGLTTVSSLAALESVAQRA